ncbi:hypothetical protein NPIL_564631 [Nephila pilipes]|uniref:Uncharacterized protein n=1 Tax=Nephila pilipes TaxID=299642 RepID=A0A8X6PPT7_NEPPI|nr:hypothetical protein NPIL_564631 [Nephila pilipes]
MSAVCLLRAEGYVPRFLERKGRLLSGRQPAFPFTESGYATHPTRKSLLGTCPEFEHKGCCSDQKRIERIPGVDLLRNVVCKDRSPTDSIV